MKHQVEYLIPGFLFPEETYRTIDERDPALALAKAPASAYCFTLYDTEEPPDLGPNFKVSPVAKNRSSRYYIGGTIHTLEEVEAMESVHPTLASNMRSNHWDRVIHCRTGNWQPFEDGDTLLDDLSGSVWCDSAASEVTP